MSIRTLYVFMYVTLTLQVSSARTFHFKCSEEDRTVFVSTGRDNYALTSLQLMPKYRAVSINGPNVTLVTIDDELVRKTIPVDFNTNELSTLIHIRDNIKERTNHFSFTSGFGSAQAMSRIRSIFSGSYDTGEGSFFINGANNELPGLVLGDNGNDAWFWRSKSPCNWRYPFVNDHLLTFIFPNGRVEMIPSNSSLATELKTEMQQNLFQQVTERVGTENQEQERNGSEVRYESEATSGQLTRLIEEGNRRVEQVNLEFRRQMNELRTELARRVEETRRLTSNLLLNIRLGLENLWH